MKPMMNPKGSTCMKVKTLSTVNSSLLRASAVKPNSSGGISSKPGGRSSRVRTTPDKSGNGVGVIVGVLVGGAVGVIVGVIVGVLVGGMVGVVVAVGASAVWVEKISTAIFVAWASSSAWEGLHAPRIMLTNKIIKRRRFL